MKRLYLLRHAKSSWDDAGLDDHDRPLAPRGERAGATIERHAREAGVRPGLVICSTAVRARQTLALVAGGLGPRTGGRLRPADLRSERHRSARAAP
jgi:phosphohistidine phosphatase